MGYFATVSTARVTTQKAVNTATPAAVAAQHTQVGLLNQLEIKIAELKVLSAQITAAGGLTDSSSNTALAALVGAL